MASEEIGGIVGLIDEIAFQMNMAALNASTELHELGNLVEGLLLLHTKFVGWRKGRQMRQRTSEI